MELSKKERIVLMEARLRGKCPIMKATCKRLVEKGLMVAGDRGKAYLLTEAGRVEANNL